MNIEVGQALYAQVQFQAVEDGDGFLPNEANSVLNNASRELIGIYHKNYPEVWIGKVNGEPDYHEHKQGEFVYNFGADFVVPGPHSQELQRLLLARHQAPASENEATYKAIKVQIKIMGGTELAWT